MLFELNNATPFSSTKRSIICKMLWIFVFCYKYVGKNLSKNLSSNYSKKLLDHAKQSATDELKFDLKVQFKK